MRAFEYENNNSVITPPSGRGLVIPVFFFRDVFSGGHLLQTSTRPKQYVPVIFVRLTFIRQNFYERWCRKVGVEVA